MKSVIASLDKSEIQDDPFPHIVKRNALDPGLFKDLLAEFPKLQHFPGSTDGSNVRLTLPIGDAQNSRYVTPLWRDFLSAHADTEHFFALIELFGEHVKSMYPKAEKFLSNADKLNVAVKGLDGGAGAHVLLSSSIDANTPVTGAATSVRGPHVDNPTKLLVALLYLRDEDESEGGDLLLFRLKQGRALRESVLPGCHFRDDSVEYVKTVRYEPNTLFVWLNSPQSIHGVSPRIPTAQPRQFCNFYCSVPNPLF
ncbi:MAG: 2OG-Fe(II) oxygenase [Proteobacteria bacterium]|nr:2OG-Fe(II) oxygenase [Pseudomonadota bacterium]